MTAEAIHRLSFSFGPTEPLREAAELLAEIHERGGRVFRMSEPDKVFCLTTDVGLAEWLVKLGARPFAPANADQTLNFMPGAYKRAKNGTVEFDIYVHTIPTEGSLWEAAA